MFLIFLLTFVSVVASVYAFFKYSFSHWSRLGVTHPKPKFPYGNRKTAAVQSAFLVDEYYKQFKGVPFFGLYFFHVPTLIVNSLEMVKNVMIKDFQYFPDRGLFFNEKSDPLSAHMFSVDAQQWQKLRHKLTPTFTSGKMKFMYPTIIDVAHRFEQCLSQMINKQEQTIEVKELLARFTTDVIGTCAFGIECNSLEDPNAMFRTIGRRAFSERRHTLFGTTLIRASPSVARYLGVKVVLEDVSTFFMKVVRDTVAYREENNVKRNDFMDLLIKLKNEGEDPLTIEQIAAQAFVFFLAGFETSSTTMMFSLYELAINPNVQEKARNEIKTVLSKHGGNFTYEAMMEMHYIDQVINEALRKYPPVTLLVRKSSKDYPIPGSDVVLPKGTTISIPVFSIQRDPEYYPNPENFEPERFSADATTTRDNMTFLPFGDGPRNCIGSRFGMMQARVGLVTLLLNYEFSPSEKTPIPMVFDETSVVLSPKDGLWLNLKKIE